jgi:hypothetical protein
LRRVETSHADLKAPNPFGYGKLQVDEIARRVIGFRILQQVSSMSPRLIVIGQIKIS